MSLISFEPAGIEGGVAALQPRGPNDWTGMDFGSSDTTNTPDVQLGALPSVPPRQIDATLREATAQYDDLLRRLAD